MYQYSYPAFSERGDTRIGQDDEAGNVYRNLLWRTICAGSHLLSLPTRPATFLRLLLESRFKSPAAESLGLLF